MNTIRLLTCHLVSEHFNLGFVLVTALISTFYLKFLTLSLSLKFLDIIQLLLALFFELSILGQELGDC
jgi:hypothetical protein